MNGPKTPFLFGLDNNRDIGDKALPATTSIALTVSFHCRAKLLCAGGTVRLLSGNPKRLIAGNNLLDKTYDINVKGTIAPGATRNLMMTGLISGCKKGSHSAASVSPRLTD